MHQLLQYVKLVSALIVKLRKNARYINPFSQILHTPKKGKFSTQALLQFRFKLSAYGSKHSLHF